MQTHSPIYTNPAARHRLLPRPGLDAIAFHRQLSGYEPSPLVELPEIAASLGLGRVFVKDESSRFGLPAFKILGASYAISRSLGLRWGIGDAPELDVLMSMAEDRGAATLYAATDGNHGRAVARVARMLGLSSRIFFPGSLAPTAKQAIIAEGADAVELALPYDDVVAHMRAAASADDSAVIVQDTSWAGYRQVPAWIVEGYSTMLHELDAQLRDSGSSGPDLVMAPAGVGSLAQAILTHFRTGHDAPTVAIVEPTAAPAVYESLVQGSIVSIDTADTIMQGLNCGTPSELAWPVLQAGVDAAVLVSDDETRDAMRTLHGLGLDAGPCGAATLAGARKVIDAVGDRLGLGADSDLVLFNTESRSANPLE